MILQLNEHFIRKTLVYIVFLKHLQYSSRLQDLILYRCSRTITIHQGI